MNFSTADNPLGAENDSLGRKPAPAHARKPSDFMGSSVASIVLIACSANLHPRQPGNSKAQNSPCAPLAVPSADVISNRHLNGTVVSWTMMPPILGGECDTPSHRL